MRAHRLVLTLLSLALLSPLLLAPLAAAKADPARVATILVQGLHRIERDQLLEDLSLSEGDPYSPDLERELERRGRHLPYLRALRVESRVGKLGVHLHLRVREASRLNFSPYAIVLDDGELDGGLQLEGVAILGRAERWLGRVLVGSYAEGLLRLQDFRLSRRLPGLGGELGVSDYDNPFLGAHVTRWWGLIGPDFRLPAGGRLGLMSGWERMDSEPAAGRDADGSEAHLLSRLRLNQPLLGRGLGLTLDFQLRNPTDERGYGRGELALNAARRQGRWQLSARLAAGLASHTSPQAEIEYLSAWRYLRAYDIGLFPAREFHFARFRTDFRLFDVPVRLRRGAEPERMALGPYFLLEGAQFREYRELDFSTAWDWGLGFGLALPTRHVVRASLGVQWDEDGRHRTVFILEEL